MSLFQLIIAPLLLIFSPLVSEAAPQNNAEVNSRIERDSVSISHMGRQIEIEADGQAWSRPKKGGSWVRLWSGQVQKDSTIYTAGKKIIEEEADGKTWTVPIEGGRWKRFKGDMSRVRPSHVIIHRGGNWVVSD